MDYADASPDALVRALEHAGRHPDPALVRACLDRRDAVTPGILALFRKALEGDEHLDWDDDDPRHYRETHAGLFLIHVREPAAFDGFRAYFSEPTFENYLEWFEPELPLYGPAALPAMRAVLEGPDVWVWGRTAAIEILGTIADAHPQARPEVVEMLRAQLPPLDADGPLVLPEGDGALDDAVHVWTWVAYALGRLRDEASLPAVERLFEAELIDEMLFGDLDDYRQMLAGQDPYATFTHPTPDLVAYYARLRQQDEAAEKRLADARRRAQNEKDARYLSGEVVGEGGTFVYQGRKVGRNERVLIRNPETGEEQTLKYKHAEKKLDAGWVFVRTAG